MKIAILSPPYLPVPPEGYGGVERIVHYLTEGLVKKGYDVTLFAPGDSKTSAKLISTFPKSIGNSGDMKFRAIFPLIQYSDCYKHAEEFDIIHTHAEDLAIIMANMVKTPIVHTIHSTLYEGEGKEDKLMIMKNYPNQSYIAISNNQKQGMPNINWVKTVYNGVDLLEYKASMEKGNYLLWLGRVTRKKGILDAITVARDTGIRLKIAAVVDPVEEKFYQEEVVPKVDGSQIEFVGEQKGQDKINLYSNALCTLYPISWHEPFGLVMAESLACGTPVIAYNIGSAPEIVENLTSGFIVENAGQMTQAVGKIETISRANCRKRVEDLFSTDKMVEAYEKVYQELLNKTSNSIPAMV